MLDMSKRKLSVNVDDCTEMSKKAKMRQSILSENGILKYDFMISLQKIAMAKIGTSFLLNQDTQQDIINLCRHRNTDVWDAFSEIEKNIVAKISQLQLPDSVCEELKCLVSILAEAMTNWIEYHNDHILYTKISECSAVDLIHNITWTTRGKIDYVQTAKKILANSGNCLSEDHKFKLACSFCLEDEIALLGSKLVNQSYLSSMYIDEHPMVYFWAAHITGDKTLLNNLPCHTPWRYIHRHKSINERIMQVLIRNGQTNDISVRFMWNQLSNEEKTKNIALIFRNYENYLNPDFLISLLLNLDYDHQQNIRKEWCEAVLCVIIEDYWWWGKYFLPTALNVLDIMNAESFWRVLSNINTRKCMSSGKYMYDIYKSLFKWLWQEAFMQLKESPFFVGELSHFVMNILDWERDVDAIELILKNLSVQQRRELAFCKFGIWECVSLIQHGKWNALDLFIKSTLSSEEDINRLQQRVIQDSGREIATRFLTLRESYNMDHFMTWAFNSEEEIADFCQSLNFTLNE